MIIKRKSAVYSVIALMLCVAVYLELELPAGWRRHRGSGRVRRPKDLGGEPAGG